MWSTEGNAAGGNIYENHARQPMLVTALVHNAEAGDKSVSVVVPARDGEISIAPKDSMTFTAVIEDGRAITCKGKCRFSISIHVK